MKKTNKVILIGAIKEGQQPTCGETVKNQQFINRFNELFDKVITVDTYDWQHRPWVLVKLFFVLLFNRGAKVVISASRAASYLVSFLYYVPLKKSVYFWVVGGNLHLRVAEGLYNKKALSSLKSILVQGTSMVEKLAELGVNNALYVPNSKPIVYVPEIQSKSDNVYRFVFLSRVHPDKGIREIMEAAKTLCGMGLKDRFIVDFYGSIEPSFEAEFRTLIAQNDNTNYKGFLNLREVEGYKTLAQYDVMLFPTYWDGEGFPGVVLDAYMAAVPIIASDWSMNAEVVKDGQTGIIIPTHDTVALAASMKQIIEGEVDVEQLRKNALAEAQRFDVKNVISEKLLKEIGLM